MAHTRTSRNSSHHFSPQKEEKIKDLSQRVQLRTKQQSLRAPSDRGTPDRGTPPPTARHPAKNNAAVERQTVNFMLNSVDLLASTEDILTRLPNSDTVNSQQLRRNIKPHNGNRVSRNSLDADRVADSNSDSALPASSTTKSSKNSALSEEVYSESYC